jgi:hypothetical protein
MKEKIAMSQNNDNLLATVIEALSSVEGNGMKTLLEAVLNAAMKIERDKYDSASFFGVS